MGRRQDRALGKLAAAAILGAVCVARLYLAVDNPTDQLTALIVGWPVAVVAFRLAVPGDVFPVSYRGGRKAHLDIGGRRGAAIVSALDRQLGLDVAAIEPFGQVASAGSTPLQIDVHVHVHAIDGRDKAALFGKLYALNHLRSDRWYKLARTVIYGRLEDEKPFSTGPVGRALILGTVPAVGLTRIYVGAHLPLDTAGGAALGLAIDAALALAPGTGYPREGSAVARESDDGVTASGTRA